MAEILYEDNHIIAVYKRSSDLAQGDKTGDVPLEVRLKNILQRNIKNQEKYSLE